MQYTFCQLYVALKFFLFPFILTHSLSSEVLTLDLSKYADNSDSNNNNNTSRTVEGMEIQVGGGGAYSPAPSSIAHSNTGVL